MKLPIACMECVKGGTIPTLVTVEFRDDGRYETTCRNGHKSVVLLQEQKFELLFEIGAYAIQDGYYREAVSSFTSSLERFTNFLLEPFYLKKV